ncbi:Tetraspanin-11, partial [Characodon lateralis]|nr:Tetraspanin-11 [Characodon lateralis]
MLRVCLTFTGSNGLHKKQQESEAFFPALKRIALGLVPIYSGHWAREKDDEEDWLTVCLKYLLFVFNFLFWVGGAAVLGVGVWTLVEKSDYLSLLASSTFAVSAYILILAGSLVVVTGFLGCCAVIREQKSCLSTYFFLLLFIFLIELVAGVLAYVYYQR